MKIRAIAAVVAGIWLLAGCQQTPPATDQTLIQLSGAASGLKVNGQEIPEALVLAYARKRGWEVRDPGQREQVYDQLAELLAVAMEADKRGLLADEAVRADLELERLNRLSGLMIERSVAAVTEDDLRAAYDKELASTGAEEFQIAHILLDSDERAQQVLAALNAGASFDELLAAQAGQAGVRDAKDLGWVRRNQLPAALAEVVAGLTPGGWSTQPVATEFGFHVALLRARRPFNAPPFDQVREAIRATLTRQRAMDLAQSIKQQAKIER
jgi:peptidyl-prolyl cis-trans isomerase C